MVTRAVIILLSSALLAGCASSPPATHVDLIIADQTFHLEIAKDLNARREGLMNRDVLEDNQGMIFIFPDALERSFWMKNCLIPIDIIFLDSRGTITSLYEMTVEPPKDVEESDFDYEQRLQNYWSYGPARFAIEFNAGTIKDLNLEINDRIPLELDTLRNMAR